MESGYSQAEFPMSYLPHAICVPPEISDVELKPYPGKQLANHHLLHGWVS
jgi:hypothetical protein